MRFDCANGLAGTAHLRGNTTVSGNPNQRKLLLLGFGIELKNHFENYYCSSPRTAMSNPNGSLSQKLCHYLDQGRTLSDILMMATH